MADLVMGAMGSLIPKLGELLKEQYNLQTGVKKRVRDLTMELEGAQAALRKVGQLPWDQLDEQVKLWAREVRESSYDMEDVLDTFLVRVQGRDSAEKKSSLKRLGKKMTNLFKKSNARRKISIDVKDIMSHLDEVTERRRRYTVDHIVARPATAPMVDPRLGAMYNKVKNLVGIDKSSNELMSILQSQQRGDVPNAKMKIVAVFGVGGLGKTTLAKAVYDKLKGDFDCSAFVPVGRNPDLKNIIKMILIGLDKERYMQFNFAQYDEIHQFIDELKDFHLKNKRYFIVIDDIWEIQSWDTIKLAFDDDNNCGCRIIITTRILEVASKASEVYKLQPLPSDSSRELFYTRISGDEGRHVDNELDEISDKILKRCGGIPLAIITMASLLVGKPRDKWCELYRSIGFGGKDINEAENTIMRILSFSYYDLTSHLRTCLLYLSAFPEDTVIPKDALVWKWVAEGFVQEEQGIWLFEIGEGYFNDLINRSLIQAVHQSKFDDTIIGCRVHDMVLDFIRSMSCEENFFTVLDNDQGKTLQSNVRRLAQHNRTMGHTHLANHFDDMLKVRSFIAQACVIETWAPLSCFTLLRVLAIENCKPTHGRRICIEYLGNLLHLRYLSLRGTSIDKIPKEIGALRFLQTLDLEESYIEETPSSSSLPIQLVCLRITFADRPVDASAAWVERLTSLEELAITVDPWHLTTRRWVVKELGSLRELRVLNVCILYDDEEESERDLDKSLRHLDKLQHLEIHWHRMGFYIPYYPTWPGLVLPRHLRHLAIYGVLFSNLPPWINPSCLPNLSYLKISLVAMHKEDLEILGRLPELRFLELDLSCSSAAISNVSGSDVVYFPKLRSCRLLNSMVLFCTTNNGVSFLLWDGEDILVPSDSNDDKLQTSVLRPFMPSLQVLYFRVREKAVRNFPYCCNLGLEYLSSLQEIEVNFEDLRYRNILSLEDLFSLREIKVDIPKAKVEAVLRRAADEHPNRPALHVI